MKIILFSALAAAVMFFTPVYAQDGAMLYKQNCAVCHNAIGKGKLVGPDLKGSTSKYEESWLIKWIKSSQTLVKNNDPIAVKLFNDNNKMVMPDQVISDVEIKTIISYIKDESARLDQPPPVNNTSVKQITSDSPKVSMNNASSAEFGNLAIWILGVFAGFLLLVIVVLGNILKELAESLSKGD